MDDVKNLFETASSGPDSPERKIIRDILRFFDSRKISFTTVTSPAKCDLVLPSTASPYHKFVKEELAKLEQEQPGISRRNAFKIIADRWLKLRKSQES